MTIKEFLKENKKIVIWDEGTDFIEFKDLRTEHKYLIKEINGVLNFFVVFSTYPTRPIFKGREKIIAFLKILNK